MFVWRFQDRRRIVNRIRVWSSAPYLRVSVRPAGAQRCQGWWGAGWRSWEAVAPAAGSGRGRAAACGMGFCFCSAFAFLVKLWGVQPKSSRGAVPGQAGAIPCRVPSRGRAGGSSTGEDKNKVVPIQLPHLTSAPLHWASLDRGFARNLPACLLNTFTLGGFCQSNLWQ